ncbi:MAG: photosystem II reaction center protein Ycf12 [Stappia sp.]|nr:photosystem II reaction center protein Ycf12 [Stappia sp.]
MNLNVIAQLISVSAVILSGPAIIFLLYFKRGNL